MYALVYIHVSDLCSLRGPRSNKSPGIMSRPNAQILVSEHHPPIKRDEPGKSCGSKNKDLRASLVAQWLRIRLPMRGTRVRALVWEDPTCRGATGPVSHNYWACASGACAPQREAATVRGPRTAMKSGPRLPQLEKALTQKRRPNTAKNK